MRTITDKWEIYEFVLAPWLEDPKFLFFDKEADTPLGQCANCGGDPCVKISGENSRIECSKCGMRTGQSTCSNSPIQDWNCRPGDAA